MIEERYKLDAMTVAGLAVLLLFAFHIGRSALGNFGSTQPPLFDTQVEKAEDTITVTAVDLAWHTAFAAPYTDYILTQGPHGQSYGHYAIDIAAGKGSPILSPINGNVTQRHIDQWGNTVLVIENDRYQVTFYHGQYEVDIGQELSLGQRLGQESNIGYTVDMNGNLCAGRNCGYHSHLNVYDKSIGSNVNPLDLPGM